MDHELDPNHRTGSDPITHWANLEGRSESAVEDLQQDARNESRPRLDAIQTAVGVLLLLMLIALAAIAVFTEPNEPKRQTIEGTQNLIVRDYRIGP